MITGYDYRPLPHSASVSKHKEMSSGQFRFVGNCPTYPSPNSTLTFASQLGQNVGFGRGRWEVPQKPKLIHEVEAQVDSFIQITVFCPPEPRVGAFVHRNSGKVFLMTR